MPNIDCTTCPDARWVYVKMQGKHTFYRCSECGRWYREVTGLNKPFQHRKPPFRK